MQVPTAEDMVSRSILGQMNPTNNDELGVSLHDAAINGYKRKLKKILAKGIDVDYMNAAGQTALFCACFEGQEKVISILLQNGANPNHRCDVGSTPVHAAGYSCNPKILSSLIEAGGDMRLHDSKGRTVRYWAICNPDNKKRRKMIEYIEKTRYFALTYTGRDILQKQSSQHLSLHADHSKASVTTSLMNLLKFKGVPRKSMFSSSIHSFGYGKIYFGNGEYLGSVATVPLVAEGALKHDEFAPNYFNGPFMVMEGMKWNKTLVTVKRLHKQPAGDSTVDMLIRENDFMARLRHPNVLLLMGLCQTNNLDGLVLIYERISCGSLFHCLHQKSESLSRYSMCELLLQVSDALLYIHEQNLLHCALTSHAIQLITPTVAKLNNFEYMVEKELPECSTGNDVSATVSSRSFSIVEEQIQHGPYNWLAPEILGGAGPTEKSDLYSLCAVMWEIIHGNIPWGELVGQQIKVELVERKGVLKVSDKVKNPFNVLLHYGLSSEPDERNLTVEQFRDIMSQIVMDHERNAVELEKNSPRATRTYKSYKSWKAPKSDTAKVEHGPASARSTEDDTGLSLDEKENPFVDFVQQPGTAKSTPVGPAKATPAGKKTLNNKNSDRISKMSISAAIGSSRTVVKTSGDPLWREKIDIIRQSQIPSGGLIGPNVSSDDDVIQERRTMPVVTSVRAFGSTASAGSDCARHHTDLKHLRDELERSKRSFFEAPVSDTWPSTSSLPPPNKYPTPAPSEPRTAKPETTPTRHVQSSNENNNRSQLGNKSSTSVETSESEVNPFKLYHTENVIAEIKAVLATRPLNKYKSISTFLPSSLNKVRRSATGELLKQTVYGALANPVAKYMRSHQFTADTSRPSHTSHTSHVEGEHTAVTTAASRIMRSHITPVSQFSMTPSSRGSAAIAGNTSDFNRSSWSGSWTLSFEDHSCKPASHCLLRESTPINTKDSTSLPKPPDFAWPQSQQSSTSKLVTPPIMRWSRSKATHLSPTVKKALSYHSSTKQRDQYSLGTGSCNPEHPAPAVETEVGDMGEVPSKEVSPQAPKKKDWSSGPRSVRDLIRKFQGHVEEHVRKQTSHCTRRNSQKKTANNFGVFSTKSTPVVRTRDYSAFYSTEYRRPTPLVNTITAASTTSYLQKIVRKSTGRLSDIMRRSQKQNCTPESSVFRERSPSPTPPARPPPPSRHDMSYLSTSTEGSELTPSDVIISTDDSEDVSVLVDRVIHEAHKQVTVEARTGCNRLGHGQLTQGHMAAPANTSVPSATSSDPVIRPNYMAGLTGVMTGLAAADGATSTELHRSTGHSSQQYQSKSASSTCTARHTVVSNLGTQSVSNLGTQAASNLGTQAASNHGTQAMSNLGKEIASETQVTGAGYFSATVSGSAACQHCYTQRFSNVNRQANRRTASMTRDIECDDESTDANSRRADTELEDLYFDDELCTENICRQRHLRLQSPSADTPVSLSGGATGGTSLTKTTTTVNTYSGVRLQSESTSQRSSAAESEMKRLKVIEDEARTSLPPLMEVDSDDSEFLRKVLDPNNDIGYYATVRVDSFDKNSPLLVDSKARRSHPASGDSTRLTPGDMSDQTGDSNTDDTLDV